MRRFWLLVATLLSVFWLWRLGIAYQTQHLWTAGHRDEAMMTMLGNDPLWRACAHLGCLPGRKSFTWLNAVGASLCALPAALAWVAVSFSRR